MVETIFDVFDFFVFFKIWLNWKIKMINTERTPFSKTFFEQSSLEWLTSGCQM
jgi:hypothetical protein